MLKVEQYPSVFCSFALKQAPSEIRFLLRPRGAASLLPALSAWFLTALPQGPGWDTSPMTQDTMAETQDTVAGTVHPIEGKHLLSHRASDLNRKCCEGKKANKVTQGCWAGWWQVWDWAPLFCSSGGLRMKPGFVLVCWVCDNPACLNFMMVLSNSKKLGVYVSMHGWVSSINITMNYHWLGSLTALHWHGLKSWRHPYFQKTSVFSDSTTATQWSAGGEILHKWMVLFKNAKISCFTWRGTFSNREMGT